MNPTQGGNPFAAIIAKIQARKQAEQQTAAPAPTPTGAQDTEDVPNQLNRGDSGGNSQYLVAVLQNLNKYVTDETKPENISIARGLIQLVTKLIAKEQEELSAKLPQDQVGAGQGGMMGGGQGMGVEE